MMDVTHKQEYRIRELETRSVTLFPGRAQVFRQIRDVPLKAGENQITIVGLTPTVDKDSIKVEGTGSAIITDMAVELLPNREIFEDVYPEYDDDDDPDSSPESDPGEEEERESEALTQIREKISLAEDQEKRAREIVNSAQSRLDILNSYGKLITMDRKNVPDVKIDEGIATYQSEREKIFAAMMEGNVKCREMSETIKRLRKEQHSMMKQAQREKSKAERSKAKKSKAKQKEQQKAARKQQEARKEQARIRKERESFWPKKVYTIRISLDANAFTPGSSRRNSITSDVEVASPPPKDLEKKSGNSDGPLGSTCDLSISYVTTDAYWSPAYDMVLSTTANTGHVCFDAQLTNRTSETWSNCKITLSTPQADFSGLNDTIPTLAPWRVRLTPRVHSSSNNNDIMYSRDEQSHRAAWADKQTGRNVSQQPRSELFGAERAKPPGRGLFLRRGMPQSCGGPDFGENDEADEDEDAECEVDTFEMHSASSRPAPTARSSGPKPMTWASRAAPPPPAAPANVEATKNITQHARKSKRAFPGLSMPRMMSSFDAGGSGGAPGGSSSASAAQPDSYSYMEGQTLSEEQPPLELAFQESTFEETGFTTTYDLPGLKTLAPSSTASKQRVARLGFAHVAFSHTVVAKYQPAAYLQAKVRNGHQLTLLAGPAGLTLDGSFLGRTAMPRCSPGDAFTLSLGVDPAIQVAYPKPDVRRSQSGVFNKEHSAVYTRTISLSNTRSSSSSPSSSSGTRTSQQQQKSPSLPPALITVLDQVPVSEDERLRVEVLQPRGLAVAAAGGPGVPTGVPGREGKAEKDWGKAVATLKKGGEVSWDVTLHAGRMVKLGLEYQCAFPTGDHAVNV